MSGAPSRMGRWYRMKRNAFTLIELLVVICIIGILTGLSVSLFGTGKAAKLNASGNRMVDLVHLARQNSISKNAITALILVTDPNFSQQYRLVTMFELLPRSDGTTPTSSDWSQVNKWETLESGIILDPASTAITETTLSPSFPTLQYLGKTISQYEYLVFLPDGSLYPSSSSSPAILNLVEGFFPPASSTPVYTSPSTSTSANYYRITVLASNSATKIDRP